ncbi:MAG: hypothetical protein Q8M76_06135 [Spirochaetaceae bacterium]|nr:hypothetical protein [Spirochaetaceae bacterium]
MGVGDYLNVCLAVVSDYRVIAIAVATILLWAALRYIGMVYGRKPSRKRLRPRRSVPVHPVETDRRSERTIER